MLEGVTLGLLVELVVEGLVNLARLSVLGEKTTEDTNTSHPKDLSGHTSIGSTLSLTVTRVSTSTLSLLVGTSTSSGVTSLGLADNKTLRDQLADGLTRVGRRNVGGLIGIEPDLSLTNVKNAGGKSLLKFEVGPKFQMLETVLEMLVCCSFSSSMLSSSSFYSIVVLLQVAKLELLSSENFSLLNILKKTEQKVIKDLVIVDR